MEVKHLSNPTNDIFYQAASVWNELSEYNYKFTYGYKKNLYTINLIFSLEDFPHLAGFQYLKDISLPRYNRKKIVSRILDRTIKYEQIKKAEQYEEMVLPRLEALVRMKDTFDNEFNLFSYMPKMYPFFTRIQANYLISSHSDITSFVFIIQSDSDETAKCNCLCCSTFKQEDRNYESNQRSHKLMKKERLHIPSGSSTILLDKLSSQATSKESKEDS